MESGRCSAAGAGCRLETETAKSLQACRLRRFWHAAQYAKHIDCDVSCAHGCCSVGTCARSLFPCGAALALACAPTTLAHRASWLCGHPSMAPTPCDSSRQSNCKGSPAAGAPYGNCKIVAYSRHLSSTSLLHACVCCMYHIGVRHSLCSRC